MIEKKQRKEPISCSSGRLRGRRERRTRKEVVSHMHPAFHPQGYRFFGRGNVLERGEEGAGDIDFSI